MDHGTLNLYIDLTISAMSSGSLLNDFQAIAHRQLENWGQLCDMGVENTMLVHTKLFSNAGFKADEIRLPG